MRISISSICYLRDIFPADCFDSVQYGKSTIHQLRAADCDDQGIKCHQLVENF